MKCLDCGGDLSVTTGNHKYCENDGIDIVLEGVPITRCLNCGSEGVAIPKVSQLNRMLASTIARRPARLSPGEIRFLRKYLGWSGVDFAEHFGVAPETVSRWENGAKKMGPTAERLLRLFALNLNPVDEYPLPKKIEDTPSKPLRASLSDDWQLSV
jgi:putative zinc finger/helix-turn-helix YgiT family protein